MTPFHFQFMWFSPDVRLSPKNLKMELNFSHVISHLYLGLNIRVLCLNHLIFLKAFIERDQTWTVHF